MLTNVDIFMKFPMIVGLFVLFLTFILFKFEEREFAKIVIACYLALVGMCSLLGMMLAPMLTS